MVYKFASFLILMLISIGDVWFDFQYHNAGENLLKRNWLVSQKNEGSVRWNDRGVEIVSKDNQRKISISQLIERPKGVVALRLFAEISCENVVPVQKSRNRAHFYLIQYDETGKSLKTDRIVASLEGTKSLRGYGKVFRLAPETVKLIAGAQLKRSAGKLSLRNVSLVPVLEFPYYEWVSGLMLAAWCGFFFFLVKDYVYLSDATVRIPLALFLMLILVGTTIPDEIREWFFQLFKFEKMETGYQRDSFTWLAPDELIHFAGFAIAGIFLTLLTSAIPVWVTCVCLFMLAWGTEMAQVFIDGRAAKVSDAYINSLGWIFGVGIVLFIKCLKGTKDKTGN